MSMKHVLPRAMMSDTSLVSLFVCGAWWKCVIYIFFCWFVTHKTYLALTPRWLILLHFPRGIWKCRRHPVLPVVGQDHRMGNIWVFLRGTSPPLLGGAWFQLVLAAKHFCPCLKPLYIQSMPETQQKPSRFLSVFPNCFFRILVTSCLIPLSHKMRLWGVIREPSCNSSSYLSDWVIDTVLKMPLPHSITQTYKGHDVVLW